MKKKPSWRLNYQAKDGPQVFIRFNSLDSLAKTPGAGTSLLAAAVEAQVGISLERFFVAGEHAHGFVRLEAVAFDRGIDLRFDEADELGLIPLREREHVA